MRSTPLADLWLSAPIKTKTTSYSLLRDMKRGQTHRSKIHKFATCPRPRQNAFYMFGPNISECTEPDINIYMYKNRCNYIGR